MAPQPSGMRKPVLSRKTKAHAVRVPTAWDESRPGEWLVPIGEAELVGLSARAEVKPSIAARECVLDGRQHHEVTGTERRPRRIESHLNWSDLPPGRRTQVARDELPVDTESEKAIAL